MNAYAFFAYTRSSLAGAKAKLHKRTYKKSFITMSENFMPMHDYTFYCQTKRRNKGEHAYPWTTRECQDVIVHARIFQDSFG